MIFSDTFIFRTFKCAKCVEEKVKAVWCRRCKLELNDENKAGACLVSEGGAHLIREHWGQRPEWEVQYTYKGTKQVCEDSDSHQKVPMKYKPA